MSTDRSDRGPLFVILPSISTTCCFMKFSDAFMVTSLSRNSGTYALASADTGASEVFGAGLLRYTAPAVTASTTTAPIVMVVAESRPGAVAIIYRRLRPAFFAAAFLLGAFLEGRLAEPFLAAVFVAAFLVTVFFAAAFLAGVFAAVFLAVPFLEALA